MQGPVTRTEGTLVATTRRRAALWLGASTVAVALAVAAITPIASPLRA